MVEVIAVESESPRRWFDVEAPSLGLIFVDMLTSDSPRLCPLKARASLSFSDGGGV